MPPGRIRKLDAGRTPLRKVTADRNLPARGASSALPSGTRLLSWQWEATTLPLPDHAREDIGQPIADSITDIDRKVVALEDLDVTLGTGSEPIVRITNTGAVHNFEFQLSRTSVLYRYTADPEKAEALDRHIEAVALPLLRQVASDALISDRFLTAGCGYELRSTLSERGEQRRKPNCDLAIGQLLPALGDRSWEAGLPHAGRAGSAVDQIDLKWAVTTEIEGEAAVFWLMVECPPNDEHRLIDTTVVVHSAPGSLPAPIWASKAEMFHAAVWPTATQFLRWLFAAQR